jgi:hypothetical protein
MTPKLDVNALKARYPITRAWKDLNLPGTPSKCCQSPLREDNKPSFSVFDEDRRFHDFATGECGDVIDLVAKVRGGSTADAIRFVERQLGIVPVSGRSPAKAGPKLPTMRRGEEAELRELSERRGFSIESLRLAEERGFLRFCSLWGTSAWCISDCRRELFEFRRLDGAKWPAYGRLHQRKAHCVGGGKNWPIGTLESEQFEKIVVVEGAPDLLAAVHFLHLERKTESVAPVAILGAGNHRLAPEALARFKGKLVRIYPHADEAGRVAMRDWAKQFKAAGAARVTAFDLSELVLVDGTAGKDLADVARIHPDCFENGVARKFWELMP